MLGIRGIWHDLRHVRWLLPQVQVCATHARAEAISREVWSGVP